MVRATLPTVSMQTEFYSRVLDQAGERPVVFRTLDVGGDKMLPYLARHDDERNPAMGWRAIRLSLDRPVLLRMQIRALLKAASGRPLAIMVDRKSTRLNSSHVVISYAGLCLKNKKKKTHTHTHMLHSEPR